MAVNMVVQSGSGPPGKAVLIPVVAAPIPLNAQRTVGFAALAKSLVLQMCARQRRHPVLIFVGL